MRLSNEDLEHHQLHILAADREHVGFCPSGILRLTAKGHPAVEGEDGVHARFMRGATVATLAVDYGATPRAIEAAIRTMMRLARGTRS